MPSFEEQAMERAGRMSRSRRETVSAAEPPKPPKAEPKDVPKAPENPPVIEKPAPAAPNMLETLFRDKENSLIMMLLLLLMDEKNDPSLVFALMYLLM